MGSPANIDYTIASYPMSAPICQHMPMSLSKFTIKCEGDDTIKKVIGAGITYPSRHHPNQKDLCMFDEHNKKEYDYSKPTHFLCDKQLRTDLV